MRIAFFVNDIQTEKESFTTTRLAVAAACRGHEVFYVDAEHFSLDDEGLRSGAFRAPPDQEDRKAFLAGLTAEGTRQQIFVNDLDVVMLRSNPADTLERPWAHNTGLIFGGVAVERGVIVLNDPGGAYKAMNKMYLALLPSEIRPRTLITRDDAEIKTFIEQEGGRAVIKPLEGFGGRNVFIVGTDDAANLNQMIEAVKDDGYVMIQEFLPAADRGDIRMILINGRPLQVEGEYACFRRVPQGDDPRSNMAVGAEAEKVEVDDRLLSIAERLRPNLVADGMFFVGIDVVEDKLIELNVFSPGGIGSPHELTGVDFAPAVIEAIERKVDRAGEESFANREIATL